MLTKEYLKDNFIDAYFIDNERQNIEVLTKSADGKKVIPTIIPYDNNSTFEALKGFMSVEQLHERTHTKKQEERKLFEEQIMRIAGKDGMIFDETKLDTSAYGSIVKLLFSDNENEDHLFALKLALFEVEKIRDSENTELKTALRQSKTKVDALLNALKIIA